MSLPASQTREALGEPPGSSRAAIEAICSELLQDVGTMPTHLVAVGRKLGVSSIREEPTMPHSGVLLRLGNDRLAIRYAASGVAARFTIAHELGHAYLLRTGFQPPDEEAFCDRFAAELLMPTSVIRPQLDADLTIERVFALRESFNVSLQAFAVQIAHFLRVGAAVADQRGVLWRAGYARTPAHELENVAMKAIQRPGLVDESVTSVDQDSGEVWRLQGQPLERRIDRAFLLLQPV